MMRRKWNCSCQEFWRDKSNSFLEKIREDQKRSQVERTGEGFMGCTVGRSGLVRNDSVVSEAAVNELGSVLFSELISRLTSDLWLCVCELFLTPQRAGFMSLYTGDDLVTELTMLTYSNAVRCLCHVKFRPNLWYHPSFFQFDKIFQGEVTSRTRKDGKRFIIDWLLLRWDITALIQWPRCTQSPAEWTWNVLICSFFLCRDSTAEWKSNPQHSRRRKKGRSAKRSWKYMWLRGTPVFPRWYRTTLLFDFPPEQTRTNQWSSICVFDQGQYRYRL